jgi:hypothetical protein
MTSKEQEKFEKEIELVEFYILAKKYGFCNPYCECGCLEKPD